MKLETSTDLLERLRSKYSTSWYGLAPIIGTHENTIANWKNGRTTIDRKYATRIADLLEEPGEYVLACLEHERESSPDVRKLWQRIAAKFRSHAASVLLAGLALLGANALPGQSVRTALAEVASQLMYIMSSRTQRAVRRLRVMQRAL